MTRADRETVADRDGWVCSERHGHGCGKPIARNEAWQIDHVVAWEISHDQSPANLQLLCWDCHKRKTHAADLPAIRKSTRQRDKHARHIEAMATGRKRQSLREARRERIRANAIEPVAPRITTEADE